MCTGSGSDYNNVNMREEIFIIFIMILNCSIAFNLSCPETGQWNYRANAYCIGYLNKYTCLLDTTINRYTETCDGPRIEIEGHKSTTNRNNFDTTKCRPERFQPKDFTTVGNSDCILKKSKCVQEGQIVSSIKDVSSLEDTKCRCDYTKGYSFIILPNAKCFCSPTTEDCSCFRKFCPLGKTLSTDYQCTTEIGMKNRQWKCSNIRFPDDGQDDDQIEQNIEDVYPKKGRPSGIAAITSTVLLTIIYALFIIVGLLILWLTPLIPDEIAERIMCIETLFSHRNNSNTIFSETYSSKETIKSVHTYEQITDQNLTTSDDKNPISVTKSEPADYDTDTEKFFLAHGSLSSLYNTYDNNDTSKNNHARATTDIPNTATEKNKRDDKDEVQFDTYDSNDTGNNDLSRGITQKTDSPHFSIERNITRHIDDMQLVASQDKDDTSNKDQLAATTKNIDSENNKHDGKDKLLLKTSHAKDDTANKDQLAATTKTIDSDNNKHDVKGELQLKASHAEDYTANKDQLAATTKTIDSENNKHDVEDELQLKASDAKDYTANKDQLAATTKTIDSENNKHDVEDELQLKASHAKDYTANKDQLAATTKTFDSENNKHDVEDELQLKASHAKDDTANKDQLATTPNIDSENNKHDVKDELQLKTSHDQDDSANKDQLSVTTQNIDSEMKKHDDKVELQLKTSHDKDDSANKDQLAATTQNIDSEKKKHDDKVELQLKNNLADSKVDTVKDSPDKSINKNTDEKSKDPDSLLTEENFEPLLDLENE